MVNITSRIFPVSCDRCFARRVGRMENTIRLGNISETMLEIAGRPTMIHWLESATATDGDRAQHLKSSGLLVIADKYGNRSGALQTRPLGDL